MKMTSYRRHNPEKKKGVRILVVLTIGAIMFMGADWAFNGLLRKEVRAGTSYLWSGTASVSDAFSNTDWFKTTKRLTDENHALREELRSLQSLMLLNSVLRVENEALRKVVNVADDAPAKTTARVLSLPRNSPYGTVVLGAGEAHGVKVGDHVVLEEFIAIARIVEVHSNTAMAEVLLDAGAQMEGMLYDEGEGVRFELTGRGGSAIAEVPRGIDVVKGDPILIPGTPFAAGVVVEVIADSADAFQTVYVALPVNLATVRFVEIYDAERSMQ